MLLPVLLLLNSCLLGHCLVDNLTCARRAAVLQNLSQHFPRTEAKQVVSKETIAEVIESLNETADVKGVRYVQNEIETPSIVKKWCIERVHMIVGGAAAGGVVPAALQVVVLYPGLLYDFTTLTNTTTVFEVDAANVHFLKQHAFPKQAARVVPVIATTPVAASEGDGDVEWVEALVQAGWSNVKDAPSVFVFFDHSTRMTLIQLETVLKKVRHRGSRVVLALGRMTQDRMHLHQWLQRQHLQAVFIETLTHRCSSGSRLLFPQESNFKQSVLLDCVFTD